ncbi:MAG: tonB-system energizer ExbB [Porticoccaceae bacterium]|nr:tonB-system energizer ExbB [Porticoccaceae bacterium]
MIHHGFRQAGLLIGCLLLSLTVTGQEPADNGTGQQTGQTPGLEVPASDPGDETGAATESSAIDVTTPENLDEIGTERQMATASAEPEPVLPHDLSPWGMFMQADWVVKAVMIGLALASIATWTVLVAKTRELRVLVKRQRQTLSIVADADSLKAAHNNLDEGQGSAELTRAAAQELKLSVNTLADAEGVKERVASSLERLEAAAGRRITKGTSILATIGATAPFVGLFGTVWGIMNSFIGISKAQTTNLAVVAPGIAEALLATALGLVAAIPAVVIYNHFARQIAAYKALVGDTSAAILRLVSRDLSRYAVQGKTPGGEE